MPAQKLFSTLLLVVLTISSNAQKNNPDLSTLDAYIADAIKKFDQPGLAVGVVKDGELVYSNGFGKLDLAKPEPVDTNSIFFIASMSKAFTACAVGLLVDDGKVDWNDPVVKHLPWFSTPDAYVSEHMMVKDLLCHRSGWGTFDGDLLWYGTDLTQREILDRHSKEPFSYAFRDEFGYSNIMFIAAAQLIEAVSGRTWDQFVTERILQPMQMTRTTVETADLARFENVALPHVRKGQDPNAPLKSMPYQALQGADGACGINSCINDLTKWDAMWANEGKVNGEPFITEATFNMITNAQLAMGGRRDGAALGWFVEYNNGEKVITHSGGMPGFILNHAVVPDKDLAVICLGNGESYSVFAITAKILNMYLGDGSADPVADMIPRLAGRDEREAKRVAERVNARAKGTKPTLTTSQIVGNYTDKIYGDVQIEEVAGKPVLNFPRAKELFTGDLEHWHYDTYKWNHADPFLEPGYITFYFDADHNVKGFKIDLHSPDFHFYKLDLVKE
ncbi:MAG: serine hydrolase [Flavobacteriales bacterium]|nr:serine hydrolase [Flavobacteriales bacterium]